jgi:protein TonB
MTQTADKLTPFLATSTVLHVVVFALVVFGPALFRKGPTEPWGTTSVKGITVGVASSLPGVPLPSPPVVQPNAKPSDTKTLHPAEVAPKPQPAKAPSKSAEVKIPERGATKSVKPAAPAPPQVAKADIPPSPDTNAIPGPATGQIALPYGARGAGQATFGGDGTFGTRFPWYVNAVTEAIRVRWQDAIANIRPGASHRVAVGFTINRSGKASEPTIVDPSGSTQLDNSARRAVLTAAFPPLPSEFRGSSVDVRFYFDYTR